MIWTSNSDLLFKQAIELLPWPPKNHHNCRVFDHLDLRRLQRSLQMRSMSCLAQIPRLNSAFKLLFRRWHVALHNVLYIAKVIASHDMHCATHKVRKFLISCELHFACQGKFLSRRELRKTQRNTLRRTSSCKQSFKYKWDEINKCGSRLKSGVTEARSLLQQKLIFTAQDTLKVSAKLSLR